MGYVHPCLAARFLAMPELSGLLLSPLPWYKCTGREEKLTASHLHRFANLNKTDITPSRRGTVLPAIRSCITG